MKVHYIIDLNNCKKYGYYCENVNIAIDKHINHLKQNDKTECIIEKSQYTYTIIQNNNIYCVKA
jgi:hypothetical protein